MLHLEIMATFTQSLGTKAAGTGGNLHKEFPKPLQLIGGAFYLLDNLAAPKNPDDAFAYVSGVGVVAMPGVLSADTWTRSEAPYAGCKFTSGRMEP